MAVNNFSFECDESNNTITLQYTIPVTRVNVRTHETETEQNPLTVIKDFKDLIVEALDKRMQSCTEQLMAHMEDLIEATGSEIVYDTKYGIKHFCLPSYRAMNKAIEKLNNGDVDYLNLVEIKQIRKALYWVELKDSERFSAGQLISALELVEDRITMCECEYAEPNCHPCEP